MYKDRSVLRHAVDRTLRTLPLDPGAVLDLGGKRDGAYARLFQARGFRYVSAGFEGDVKADLATESIPLPGESFDTVLVCTVLMYLEDAGVQNILRESRRLLKPGGRLLVFEPFLSSQTDHGDIRDLRRWTVHGMIRLLEQGGFDHVACRPLGGIFGSAFTILRDLMPSFLRPVRLLCTLAGSGLDHALGGVPVFKNRNNRYYQGYFASARKPLAGEV